MTRPRVAAVVLAAGASRRMGRDNKLLLPIEGEPMVHRTVRRVHDAGCSPVVVVTGHEASEVRAALAPLDVEYANSPDPSGPTSSSLHAGIRVLPDDVDAFVAMLSDMVHITAPMMRQLVDALEASGAPLAVSRFGDVLAPPLAFRRSLWPELLAWHGEGCGKAVVKAHAAAASILDWPVDLLADVDTPEDYARVR